MFSASFRLRGLSGRFAIFAILVGLRGNSAKSDQYASNYVHHVISQYSLTLSNYQANPANTTSAWQFARACFESSELATNNAQCASLANAGIAAAKAAIAVAPDDPASHLYLGLNLGQLARTKLLGALALLKEMESAFLESARLDEKFHYTAAHRSLGMLYFEAPGWPVSLGSRSKARKHFEKALELLPDYPDNHLSALEAYVQWKDKERVRKGIRQYQRIVEAAKEKYRDAPRWEQAWLDWEVRWAAIERKAKELLE
jgi:tetratricopeptide (TPR) repeat protein